MRKTSSRRLGSLFAISLPLALAACGANTSGNTLTQCRALTATAPQRPSGFEGSVFTIVMENHDRSQIIGSADAPYINSLAALGAEAAGYHDSYVHPSEPNYIWMVAGENFGILNDDDPSSSQTISGASHLMNQMEMAGLTWKTYQESMGQACGLKSHGSYAAKHNPFAYFSDINGWNGSTFQPGARCTDHMVDYAQLDADLAAGTVPTYAFITPNLINDMHDGSVQVGDTWLSHEVPKILASEAYQKGGVLFLLWDEGAGQGDDPPFIVVSPNAKPGFVSHVAYDTSSYLKTVETMLGVEPLPCADHPEAVSTMDDLFAAPL